MTKTEKVMETNNAKEIQNVSEVKMPKASINLQPGMESYNYNGQHRITTALTFNLDEANNIGCDVLSSISEMIDNSIDAGANKICLIFDGNNLTIEDNGCGMSPNELVNKYFSLGESDKNCYDNNIGYFGRGGHFAALNIAHIDTNILITTTKAGYPTVDVKWPVKHEDTMTYNVDIRSIPDKPGTKFQFVCNNEIKNELKNNSRRSVLIYELGKNFCGAIESGVKITFDYLGIVDVKPIDVLYSNSEYAKKYMKTVYSTLPAVEDYCGRFVKGNNFQVKIDVIGFNKSSIDYNLRHEYDKELDKTEATGIYLYTEDGKRLIGFKRWTDCMGKVAHTEYNGLRVKVYVPKPLWRTFGVQCNKIVRKLDFARGIFNEKTDSKDTFYETLLKYGNKFRNEVKEKSDNTIETGKLATSFKKYDRVIISPKNYHDPDGKFFVKEGAKVYYCANQTMFKQNKIADNYAITINAILNGLKERFGDSAFTIDNVKDYILSNEFIETLK